MNDQAYARTVKKTLLDCIADLDFVKWLFLKHPETDFTRDRKFSFQKLVKIMLLIDGGSLQNELMKYFSFADDTPTKSAFCQQRAKVLPEAIRFLFSIFTERLEALDTPKLFHGYRILAADGSDINILYNPLDTETFHKNGDNRGYNQLHLNAFYAPPRMLGSYHRGI